MGHEPRLAEAIRISISSSGGVNEMRDPRSFLRALAKRERRGTDCAFLESLGILVQDSFPDVGFHEASVVSRFPRSSFTPTRDSDSGDFSFSSKYVEHTWSKQFQLYQ